MVFAYEMLSKLVVAQAVYRPDKTQENERWKTKGRIMCELVEDERRRAVPFGDAGQVGPTWACGFARVSYLGARYLSCQNLRGRYLRRLAATAARLFRVHCQ